MSETLLRWPVDAHVHFHTVDRVGPTLDAAAAHFQAFGSRTGTLVGALLLGQMSEERVFEQLPGAGHAGEWNLEAVPDEPESLIARRKDCSMAVVCGRQVRTADGLEVLALGTRETFADGLPLESALETVRRSGALTVLPWGFGKWTGRRRRQVEAALDADADRALLLGDNGGRPRLTGSPSLIRRYQARGFRVLPGTDPLRLPGEHRRVGSFGFLAGVEPSPGTPWRDLRAWITGPAGAPVPYGRACGAVRFVLNQIELRFAGPPATRNFT